MKKLALGVVGAIVLLAIGMVVLSESGEVVVIRTSGATGTVETRIWVVDTAEGLLVRGSEGKAWVEAARRATRVELERDGVWRRYAVVDLPGPAAQQRVNALMRDKYGMADLVIGWLRDYDRVTPLLLMQVAAPSDQSANVQPMNVRATSRSRIATGYSTPPGGSSARSSATRASVIRTRQSSSMSPAPVPGSARSRSQRQWVSR